MKSNNRYKSNKKKPSPMTYRICGFIMKLLGVFTFLVGILLISIPSSAILFLALGIIFYLLGRSYKKLALTVPSKSEPNLSFPDNIGTLVTPSSVTEEPKKTVDFKHIPIEEHHIVAGTSYRQKEIFSLGYNNADYDMTKREIIDFGMEDDKIFKLCFSPTRVLLEEEPDNQYDPNAVKVIIDNVHVGYVKKGSCSHVKKLIREDKINSICAEIYGGKYKVVYSDYDEEKDKDIYTLERGEHNFAISIYITLK